MRRARAAGRGSVFTPSDFLDLAAGAAVDQAVSRLVKSSALRRPLRATDVAQVVAHHLAVSDKKVLATSAVQAPAWMRPTLVLIASTVLTGSRATKKPCCAANAVAAA